MKDKKALSEIVSYVMLIIIVMSISILVFAWLNYEVNRLKPSLGCSEEVSIMIRDINCYVDGSIKILNLTIENRGKFKVDGFNIKIANTTTGSPIYNFKGIGPNGQPIDLNGTFYLFAPSQQGMKINQQLDYTKYNTITKIQIIPVSYERDSTKKAEQYILCSKSTISQQVSGC